MTVKAGGTWSGLVVCRDSTGALATPSAGPAGVLYVDGTANGAEVTVSGANPYKWTLTLPALTAGQCVSMYITATIATIATAAVVAEDVADTKRVSDLVDAAAAPSAADIADAVLDELLAGHVTPGSLAVAITDILADTGEIGAAGAGLTALGDTRLANLDAAISTRSTLTAADVWGYTARTISSFGSLVTSIVTAVWAAAIRTLTSSAAATTAAVTGSNLNVSISASYAATISSLTIPATWTKLWWTLKDSREDTDAEAILQVLVSNPAASSTDGVQYIMAGAASVTQRTLGGLTVDQGAGTVTIALDETLTAVLAKGDDLDWDIKCLESGGACTVLTDGECDIARTVTRATS